MNVVVIVVVDLLIVGPINNKRPDDAQFMTSTLPASDYVNTSRIHWSLEKTNAVILTACFDHLFADDIFG